MTVDVYDLAGWIKSFDVAAVPPGVMHKAALLVLDSIGVAIAAVGEENAGGVLRFAAEEGGNPHCHVIGTGLRLPVTRSVLANGALIRALDYNDFMGGGRLGGHPSDNIAVALCFGEFFRSAGLEFLGAIVMGYELYGRLQDLIDRGKPWDHTSASGLVAPAIAGRLMGLSREQIAQALAMSAAHCVGMGAIRTGEISSSKMLANAVIAETGAMMAILASGGLTGPIHVLDGRKGLTSAVLEPRLETLIAPCGPHFRIMDVAVKPYPCIGTGQTAVAAALKIRDIWPDGLPGIERVEVQMADTPAVRSQVEDEDRKRPDCREAADHSFYFLIAAALIDGEFAQTQFMAQRWTDPSLKSLMDRISIKVSDRLTGSAPGGFPCSMTAITLDGREAHVEVDYPPGHPKKGISDQEVLEKFVRSTRSSFDSGGRSRISDACLALECDSSVAELMACTAREDCQLYPASAG